MSDTRSLRSATGTRVARLAAVALTAAAALFVAPATSQAAGCSDAAVTNNIGSWTSGSSTYTAIDTRLVNTCASGASIPAGTIVDLTIMNTDARVLKLSSLTSSAYTVYGPTSYVSLNPGASITLRYVTRASVPSGRSLGMMVYATRLAGMYIQEEIISIPGGYVDGNANNNSWSGSWFYNSWYQF